MIILVLFLLAISSVSFAQQLAFPTAEGWGRFSTGGRGGIVCHVTNLNTGSVGSQISGSIHHEGTIKYCVGLNLSRTIVFDVEGTIVLPAGSGEASGTIRFTNPNVTIAGHTSPGDGILIRSGMIWINTHDVIMRHIRSRIGATSAQPGSMGPLQITGASGLVYNVIVDHCSLSWGTDETLDISQSSNVTVQRTFITEGVDATAGYGILVDGAVTNLSFIQNLIWLFKDRPPLLKSGSGVQFVNNYVINQEQYHHIWPKTLPITEELIGNYFRNGPLDVVPVPTIRTLGYGWLSNGVNSVSRANHDGSSIYVQGNIHNTLRPTDSGAEDALVLHGAEPITIRTTPFGGYPTISSLQGAANVPSYVLSNAGARVPSLDAVDTRVISDVQANTRASIPTNESGYGGYPTLGTSSRAAGYDDDHDGIPNAWETSCSNAVNAASTNHTGLSNSDGSDAGDIVSTTGYSALEHYLNEVAGDYPSGTCGGLDVGDTTGPSVSITAPTNGSTISTSSVTYSATATDAGVGMLKVEFYVDGSIAGTDTDTADNTFTINLDSTQYAEGNRVLEAKAYDQNNNWTISSPITVNVDNIPSYTAVHTSIAPTINGNLSEFASANLIEFNSVVGNETDCKMMHDSTNLYVGCTTTDTNLTGSTTANDNSAVFGEDSLEIVLDPDNSNGSWTSSDYKLVINVQNARYDAHTQSNTAWSYGGSTAVALSGDIDGVADDTSWTIEAAIPWSSMGVTPSTSDIYAINLQINDKDGTASTVRYRWNGTSSNNLSDAMDVVLGEPAGGDTTDPVVSITQPSDGSTIGGTYTIRADAQDDSGIQDVQFYRDTSTSICSADTVAPFECAFDTTAISEGSHTFHAVARDNVSPTPNDGTSATVTVTVDNTPTSAPTSLTVTPSYSDIGYIMIVNWGDVTDAVYYEVERCDGTSCSDFEVVNTELSSDYLDESLLSKTEYCYRIRAFDVASNPSSYSSTVCDLTLDAIMLDEPTTLSTTHNSVVSILASPDTLSTNHSGTVTVLGAPDTLSTNHSGTPVFLGQPSNLGTP